MKPVTTNSKKVAKRIKNLFPRMARGGYSCRIRFYDEARGERYFDTEWGIHAYREAGAFSLTRPIDFVGRFLGNNPATNSIGCDLHVGDELNISPSKWNMRGKKSLPPKLIRVTRVHCDKETGFVEIGYEYP